MSNPTPQTAVVPMERREVEFIPFGGDEKIKLSVGIIKSYVAIATKSGKLPEDRECIRFMLLCRARKLNPFEGDCFLQGYDGHDGPQFSLITAHQAFLKRAEVNDEYDGMESGVVVKDAGGQIVDRVGDMTIEGDTLIGGWAKVFFKKRSHPMHKRLKLQTFNKGFGRWKDDAAGMIVKCAEADALRSSFPTMLGGLYTPEEGPAINIESTIVKAPEAAAGQMPANVTQMPKPTVTTAPPKPVEQPKPKPEPKPQTPPPPTSPPKPVEPPAPAPEPEPEPAPSEPEPVPTEPEPAPSEPAPSAPATTGETEELRALRAIMQGDGVTEAQVVAFCKGKKIAKDGQNKLGDLSTAKLQQLVKAWPNIKAGIKEQKV